MILYFTVAGCFMLGYLLQQPLLLGSERGRWLVAQLNRWIICIALPALILLTVPQLAFSVEHLFALTTPWLLMGFWYLSLRLPLLRSCFSSAERAVLFLLLILGNTAFLGVPLIRALQPDSMLLAAVVYDQLGSFLILSLVATAVVASQGDSDERSTTLQRVRAVLLFPPFIALLTAMFLSWADLIDWQDNQGWLVTRSLLDMIASTLLPLSMVVIGLQFRFRLESGYARALVVVICGKMLLAPLIVFVSAFALTLDAAVAIPSILQSAMPPMVTGVILLINAGVAPRLAASVLGFGTIAAAITLPLWFYVVGFYPATF